jgi:hypothetical protein
MVKNEFSTLQALIPPDTSRGVINTSTSAPLRSIRDICADLSKDIPPRFIKTRQQGKQDIAYLEWHTVCRFLDFYAAGWQFEIRSIQVLGELVVITGRLSIPCAEGWVYRESCGSEPVDTKAFGDAISIAEQMSFKRCAARFGLGLSLYQK